ncbi:hypothetical protein RHMOL_Rhmol08G0042800 [Rhododendron molle]|uniref:Uncharacterized protein n=1 Tax=Rhododendron molle TaxID=49168 RepID=A0ACC0MLH8_RHOML|nr:hypothetical protein RHMOL_Rhmol08G0042800 [Rhododendron molle]
MLYQTHHPFFFPLNPFTTPILSLSTTTTPPPLPPPTQEMDCVEGALKSSFGPDPSKKTQNQPFSDDPSAVNGQSGVSGDDFFVDDLLDFSEGGIEDGFCEVLVKEENGDGFCQVAKEENKEETEEENKKDSPPSRSANNFSVVDDFPSVPCTELSVPADDLADLEWLSNFVDDSFPNYSFQYPAGKLPEKPVPVSRRPEPAETPVQTKPCFRTPVQTKARSKRSRTGFRVWSLDSISLTDSSSTSSSSSSTTQTADSVLCPPLQPAKKQRKRKLAAATAGGGGGTQQPRRCSHCLVQKTPQWRAGPLGAKTLCNACGVRFKSGRLLPEYRPACSPTFLSDVHSNNHRKVLEMRRKKEGEAGMAPPVQSF